MNARIRRRLEMGARALVFSQSHPDPSPGYSAAVARLENRLARGKALLAKQHDGMTNVRRAALIKRDLQGAIRRNHLAHLNPMARVAERALSGFEFKFQLRRGTRPYLEFRNAARAAELERVADEVVMIVAVIDRLNRVRFAEGSALLAVWESASNVMPTRRRSGRYSKLGQNPLDDLPPAA